jgi:protein-tyrosine phosphatase
MMPSISRRLLLLGLGATVVVVAAVGVYRHKKGPYHFRIVTPGVLYRSGFLGAENLEKVIATYGIRTVLNLSEEREKHKPHWGFPDEVRICREHDVRLVEMPILSGVPPNRDQVARWLALLEDPAARPILVHCDHGVMRTGMLVAVYQMEFCGASNRAALEAMPMFGHTLDEPHKLPMKRFVLDYVPRARAAATSVDASSR